MSAKKFHVYVVLEFEVYRRRQEPKIHGVFYNKQVAVAKKESLKTRHNRQGYLAVLKFTVEDLKVLFEGSVIALQAFRRQ